MEEVKHNKSLMEAVKDLYNKQVIRRDKDIAEKTGYTKSTVSGYINGNAKASDEFLNKFEDAFGIKLSNYLNGPPKPTPPKSLDAPLTGAHVTLQDYIDELKDSRDRWYTVVNSILGHIEKDTKAVLAHQKAWEEYEAEKASGGDDDKKGEIMNKMGKLVRGYLLGRASDHSQSDSDNEGIN